MKKADRCGHVGPRLDVVLEGRTRRITEHDELRAVADTYAATYGERGVSSVGRATVRRD